MQPPDDLRATLGRWREIRTERADLPTYRMVVIASHTAAMIEPMLGVTLADAIPAALPHIRFGDYNQVFQACLDPGRHGVGDRDGADGADDVVVLWRIEDVFERAFHAWGNADPDAEQRLVDGALRLGQAIRHLVGSRGGPVIVADAPVPIGFGHDHDDPAHLARLAALSVRINAAVDHELAGTSVDRLRVSALQLRCGTAGAFDRRTWVMYRQPYTEQFNHTIARSISATVAARTATPPKVLVLDCDDTLWDGTFVDDGIGGLQAGDGFPGFAFRSFQYAAQRLRHQGVLLALASKNDDDSVRQAFAGVDGMVLTDADIAGRRVSWDPKPDAIAALAHEFNLGLESFVFVDDSPYEIGAVASQLPMVRTLQVPDDIEALPDLLAESGWFRGMRVTSDDRERTARIQAEQQRTSESTTMSHEQFLASLGLRLHAFDVGATDLGRATQLINKTNQFNLTTIRRSEAEVAELVSDPDSLVLGFAVDDRFGEYGMIGVAIGRRSPAGWLLDTFLMSCRVLGRGVETGMLACTVDRMRSTAGGPVGGHYVATPKNAIVADLLTRHGFETIMADRCELPSDRPIAIPSHLTIVSP